MGAEATPPGLRLYPPPLSGLDPRDIYRDLVLPEGAPPGAPFAIINAASTLDGRAAVGGRSTPIGGSTDRVVMRNVRCAVDAVLVGAGTLRSENLDLGVPQHLCARRTSNGLAAQPLQVVLKGESPLPEDRRLYETARDRLLIIASSQARTAAGYVPTGATVREVPATRASGLPDPAAVLRLLGAEFGVRRLLVEGGPSVSRSFLVGGHVGELFLTLAPEVAGEEAPGIVAGGAPVPEASRGWRLVSVHADGEGALYLRYGSG